jgi:hypothetical protein
MIAAPCESPFEGRVIFVLGTRRSGTTWLQELLLAHPEAVGVGAVEVGPGRVDPRETVIMMALEDFWANAHDAQGEGLSAFLERDEIIIAMRRFCDSLFAQARDVYKPGATWFIEKSPSNLERLPLLAAVYPDAWYVSIVRDGRDVVRSVLETPMAPLSLAEAAAQWAIGLDQLQRHRHLFPRFREVRYEAVLTDPVAYAADLLDWLGLDRTDEVLRAVEKQSKREVARFGAQDPIGPGKWLRLPARDREMILDIAGDWLTELGYID